MSAPKKRRLLNVEDELEMLSEIGLRFSEGWTVIDYWSLSDEADAKSDSVVEMKFAMTVSKSEAMEVARSDAAGAEFAAEVEEGEILDSVVATASFGVSDTSINHTPGSSLTSLPVAITSGQACCTSSAEFAAEVEEGEILDSIVATASFCVSDTSINHTPGSSLTSLPIAITSPGQACCTSMECIPGTPVLMGQDSESPHNKGLPDASRFSTGVTDYIVFENLPGTTGRFEKLKKILSSFRSRFRQNSALKN